MGNPTTSLDLALQYASRGIPVFPTNPPSGERPKQPRIKNGLNSASADEAVIRQWGRLWEGAGVGMPTGAASGVFVVDLDTGDNGEPLGEHTAHKIGIVPELQTAPHVRTPSGGWHFYFKHGDDDEVFKNSAGDRKGLGEKIDTRGEGGYVLAPGSPGYAWATERTIDDVNPLPPTIFTLMKNRRNTPESPSQEQAELPVQPQTALGTLAGQIGHAPRVEGVDPYVVSGIAAELDKIRNAAPGTRNHTLNEAAFSIAQFVGGNHYNEAKARAEIAAVARSIGLEPHEIEMTIDSAFESGKAQPRDIPPPQSGMTVYTQPIGTVEESGNIVGMPGVSVPRFVGGNFRPGNTPRPRSWLYGKHLIRGFVSATISPGGVGKSSLVLAEALAMSSGRPLLGVQVREPLRVWAWNGEDPIDEAQRRLEAASRHYNVKPEHVQDRLFIDSGRDTEIKIATDTRDGALVVEPVVEAIIEHVRTNRIDVISIDPFVSCHSVSENDNGAIEKVVKAWGRIAERCQCAVELVHHSRKAGQGQTETTVEDGRGASSLLSAVRSARALNRMSKTEGENFGIPRDDHWRFFRVDNGKSNLAPPAEVAVWRQMVGVCLDNATDEEEADNVGVATKWSPPDAFDGVTFAHLQEFKSALSKEEREGSNGGFRADPKAGDLWAGTMLAHILAEDVESEEGVHRVKVILKTWIKKGEIVEREYRDKQQRKTRKGVFAGTPKGGEF